MNFSNSIDFNLFQWASERFIFALSRKFKYTATLLPKFLVWNDIRHSSHDDVSHSSIISRVTSQRLMASREYVRKVITASFSRSRYQISANVYLTPFPRPKHTNVVLNFRSEPKVCLQSATIAEYTCQHYFASLLDINILLAGTKLICPSWSNWNGIFSFAPGFEIR